jgi:hypothetical protein
MKKLLIYKDNGRLQEFKTNLDQLQSPLESFYNEMTKWNVINWDYEDLKIIIEKAINIKPTSSTGFGFNTDTDYNSLGSIINAAVKDKIVNQAEQPKVLGFNISKSKLKELIETPAIPQEVLESLDMLCKKLRMMRTNDSFVLNHYEIDNGKIIISQSKLKEYEESCCHYTTSNGQIELTKDLIEVCDVLNSFKNKRGHLFTMNIDVSNAGQSAFFEKNGRYYPHHTFVETHGK